MSLFFLKITKLSILILIPALFISGSQLDDLKSNELGNDNGYVMQVEGNLNEKFTGIVSFETTVESEFKDTSFATLKLRLRTENHILAHSIEFLISKENTTDILPAGVYKISKNKEGFLNYFDGVFGFANIEALGELPLFAESGKIQIDYLDDSRVKGKLNIQMSNTNGKFVQLNGDFIAAR
jgi:hypothetical protein